MTAPAGALEPRIRLLVPDDRDLIRRGLLRVGAESLYRRFGYCPPRPDALLDWVERLAGPSDLAVGACHPSTGEPLGLARAVVEPAGQRAELAVTVVDAWQGRRVGSALVAALCRELTARGVETLLAMVPVPNRPAVALLRALGARPVSPPSGGSLELEAPLRGAARTPSPSASIIAAPRGCSSVG